jgi:hypothetical protein
MGQVRLWWMTPGLVLGLACSSTPSDGSGNEGNGTGGGGAGIGVLPAGGNAAPPAGGGSVAQPPIGTAGTTGSGTAGAGGAPPSGTAGTGVMPPVAGPQPGLNDMTESTITRECRGFSFDGLVYSPGGTTLPNTCEPFNPTTNNPYAVRCVDVWPWFETIYAGDDFCILPPPPDKGVQFGIHPQHRAWFDQVSKGDMSGYAAPPAGHAMPPGGEEERNYHTAVGTTAEQKYYRNHTRMRGGSHHMINSTSDANTSQEMWGPGSPDGLFGGISLPGAQRPDENAPKSLEKPAEDIGLYGTLPAGTGVTLNMHHFNSTDSPILKEVWINLWWETDATIPVKGINGLDLFQVATLSIPVGSVMDLHYSAAIAADTRLLTLFGHRHAWTTSFTSWVETTSGQTELLYQSFDWFDEPTYRYDSVTQNPVADKATVTDGAYSGIRILKAGERLHYNCHITYNDARAATVNSPQSPAQMGTLRFANQAFTAEMCILFGSSAQNSLTGWAADVSPLPDFAVTQ